MGTEFYFSPAETSLPTLNELKGRWRFIPDPSVRAVIASEHQYLHFQEFLLNRLRFRTARGPGTFAWSARAGAVKAALLLQGSIIEAAVQAHGEARGYVMPGKRLMFGKVLEAWEKAGKPGIEELWDDIHLIKDHRNLVHLHRAAADEDAQWRSLLQREQLLLNTGRRVLAGLQTLTSPADAAPAAEAAKPAAPAKAGPSAVAKKPAEALSSPAALPVPDPMRASPDEMMAWLNANVDQADPAAYRAVLVRWVEATPHLDMDDWARLDPQVESDRRDVENEEMVKWAEEEYERYEKSLEEMRRGLDSWEPSNELTWEDEQRIAQFMDGNGWAPEEHDEDNPNWYDDPEPEW